MSLTNIAIAHRGGSALGPENTLTTFAMSHALGLRLLETDVQTTADGVALAFHDSSLRRLTGLPGRVRDYTWAQLRDVRVGSEPLLRLDELLASFPDTSFLVDVKSVSAIGPTIQAIRSTNAGQRVCVAGGLEPWLRTVAETTRCQRAMGFRALTLLMTAAKAGIRPPSGVFREVCAAHLPTQLCGLPWMTCPKIRHRLIEMAHDHDILVRVWTVNEAQQMREFLDSGADAVVTDRPHVLRDILIARGDWRAPQPSLGAHRVAARTRQLRPTVANSTPANRSTRTLTASPALSV